MTNPNLGTMFRMRCLVIIIAIICGTVLAWVWIAHRTDFTMQDCLAAGGGYYNKQAGGTYYQYLPAEQGCLT